MKYDKKIRSSLIALLMIAASLSTFVLFVESVDADVENNGTCSPEIVLPEEPITLYAWEFPDDRPSAYKLELDGITGDYNVSDGFYNGWCVDYGTDIPNGVPHTVRLYSSYDPPEHLAHENWSKVNYLINNVPEDADASDVQRAIFYFINLGPWDWNDTGYMSKPVSQITKDMMAAANESGDDYCPVCDDKIAIICDPVDGANIQITFIEKILCEKNPHNCNPEIQLPDEQITLYAWEFPYGEPFAYELELDGITGDYNVSDGFYNGWCVDYGTDIPNGLPHSVRLYSSYDPPVHLAHENWSKVNYLINHVPPGADASDVQRAIFYFINLGPWDWDYTGYMTKPVSPVTLAMMAAANESGDDYCPGCDDKIAIICDPVGEENIQITFIEVTLCEDEENGAEPRTLTTTGITIQPPIARATVDKNTGTPGEVFTFNASESYHPQGIEISTYHWDFGDGIIIPIDMPTIKHMFTVDGTYNVMLTVEDTRGLKGSLDEPLIIEIVTANNPPENLIVTPETTRVHKNNDVRFTMSAIDPDEGDTLRFEIDWDDGTTQVSDHVFESDEAFETSHQWETFGVYTVTVMAFDNQDASTAPVTTTIYVDVMVIEDVIYGWLIDTNFDGEFNVFRNLDTGRETILSKHDESTYLIDANNDNNYDYMFNVDTETLSAYSSTSSQESNYLYILLILGGGLLIALFIILAFLLYKKRQDEKSKAMNPGKHSVKDTSSSESWFIR